MDEHATTESMGATEIEQHDTIVVATGFRAENDALGRARRLVVPGRGVATRREKERD